MAARLRQLLTLALAGAVPLAAGCGAEAGGGPAPRSTQLVDLAKKPPYVNTFDVDPADGSFLLTTNRGFFRIDPKTKAVEPVRGEIRTGGASSPVGTFLELVVIGPKTFLGSGHPDDTSGRLPTFLGFLRTDDGGKTWQSLSRMGEADLHKIIPIHDKLYAYDAVLGGVLISDDGGRTFAERFTPKGLVIDFVVDPEDENYLLAATEDQLFRSEDQGRRWRGVEAAEGIRLTWPQRDTLLRADKDGTVRRSTDRGASFRPIGRVPGEPYKFETVDARHHYLALSDGTIMETRDAGVTWTAAFKP